MLKKFVFLAVLGISITSALRASVDLTTGVNYGFLHFVEPFRPGLSDETTQKAHAPGISLNFYAWNDYNNLGFYMGVSSFLPALPKNRDSDTPDLIAINAVLGFAFKYLATEFVDIRGGLGFSFRYGKVRFTEALQSKALMLGGLEFDFAARIKMNKGFLIEWGTKGTVHTNLEIYIFDVQPYINIGFAFY